MLCMPSSIFEEIVISIIKSQMSFSKLQRSNSEIMPGDRESNFQSGTIRDDYWGGRVDS